MKTNKDFAIGVYSLADKKIEEALKIDSNSFRFQHVSDIENVLCIDEELVD